MDARGGAALTLWFFIFFIGLILLANGQFLSFILLILIGFLLYFLSGVHIVPERQRLVVRRLGKVMPPRGPNVTYVLPIIESVVRVIDLRIVTYSFRAERVMTKDNVPVKVDAVAYYRVVDPYKAVLEAEDFEVATHRAAQTSLREVIGTVDLDTLLTKRDEIGVRLKDIIDEKTEKRGVKVESVEISDIILPEDLEKAMALQAQAERERRARVTLAQAEVEAAEKMISAAKKYEENPIAFKLRRMNMLYEIGRGAGTKILIPVDIPFKVKIEREEF